MPNPKQLLVIGLAASLAFLVCIGVITAVTGDEEQPQGGGDAPTEAGPTPEGVSFAEILVWRFCSGVLASEVTPEQVDIVSNISPADLDNRFAREIAVTLRESLRQEYLDLQAIERVGDLCLAWLREENREFMEREDITPIPIP